MSTSLAPSVFTVLIWGPITDLIGRKKAMILVPILNGTRALVYLLNAYYVNMHVQYMLFGSIISCFYGEFQGVVALCYAYLADITKKSVNERTMRMAFIEASLFLAGVPAGLSSGYLLQKIGYVAVFGLNIGINIIILFYVVFFISENPGRETETEALLQNQDNDTGTKNLNHPRNVLNPFVHLHKVFLVVIKQEYRKVVLPILCSFGFAVCAVYGELVVQTLFLDNRPFSFTPQTIGYYSAAQSAVRGLGVILVTQLSFRVLKWSDYNMAFVGILSQIICYILIGVSRTNEMAFIVNISGLAIPVATTTLRSIATKQVSSENYGAILAALEAFDAIAAVVTNSLSLWTFDLTLNIYSGIVFFTLSIFALFSLLFLIIAKVNSRETLFL